MNSSEVKEKYLKFFQKKGHKIIPSAPLVLQNDTTTLFTSSGMQPLVPYLLGENHPEGKRLVNSQPAIRIQDIEEVGDNRHTIFFEMLGNWSLGDYFKENQLAWIWEFFTKELNLKPAKLYVSVFKGTDDVPKDVESAKIWQKLGVPENHIFYYGVEKNWWSRSGTPDQMPAGEIGGPDSEVFFEFTSVKHDKKFGEVCHPNCDCGRFIEIGNSVFIQYKKLSNSKLEELDQKNVDFGGGLERITAATNNNPDVFKIDIFKTIIEKIEQATAKAYKGNEWQMRIIADHIRAANALASDGVSPANKLQGYVMRRLIRRAVVKMKLLKGTIEDMDFKNLSNHDSVIEEVERFKKTLDKGLVEVGKIKKIDGKKAFDLYQTYGFPLEISEELFKLKGQEIDHEEFEEEFEKHKNLSRTASAGMFKGGLADHSNETTKLHTVTHLLHESLRRVLGEHVAQRGSNITSERLRFDFSHSEKLKNDEINEVEDMINKEVKKSLPVSFTTKTLKEALEEGALAFFGEKYGDNVNVYSIGDFSKEVCGGPHVTNTSEIGHVRIIKEESAGAGVRRIYAKIE
ncbi:MAG: alanine--tRNA ligase [Patescibacteria group bacterium]